jgi:putative ABC transport system ATP-binding protein
MIELKHIYKDFNTTSKVNPVNHVLKNVNLKINDGDFITIIGSNGSGKTTLLNTIAGHFKPTKGSIFFDKDDVTNLKENERAKYVGRVFQDPTVGTISDISIEENLALARKRGQKRKLVWALKKEYIQPYKDVLKPLNLGIENSLHEPVSTLSGGQRQALTLIMATLQKPSILLLDEHTAALDPKTSKKIMDLTTKLVTENHLTTLMITHNMRDALKYGNRIIMISDGKIIFDGDEKAKKSLTVDDLYKKFDQAEGK